MDILNFFAVVDRARIDKGLSKATFYEMCNISSSAASQWRKGKTLPAKTTLARIAEVLDLDASELISYIYPEEETKKDPVLSDEALSADDMEFLTLWKTSTEEEKAVALATLRALHQKGGK